MRLVFTTSTFVAAIAGTALCLAAPARAQIGISIGVPGVHIGVEVPAYYYGPGYYPPGPCDAYTNYYAGDCGYAVYSGPVYLGGAYVSGPHYYRWLGGRPYFWYRGGWHWWGGWNRVNYNWDHREGFGWHGGHWDRGWGDEHWDHDGPDHWHPDHPDHPDRWDHPDDGDHSDFGDRQDPGAHSGYGHHPDDRARPDYRDHPDKKNHPD
jgi:hypothetical protein